MARSITIDGGGSAVVGRIRIEASAARRVDNEDMTA
jgi:hypothetical protein